MKDAVLLELAARWERDAKSPEVAEVISNDPQDIERRARDRGARMTKRECADTLRSLVALLGDAPA